MSEEALGVSIRIFLRDGSPASVREVTKSDWNGRVITGARPQLPEIRKSGDLDRTGVYVLVDEDFSRVYIGESGTAASRLTGQASPGGKEFWSRLFLAVSDRDDFTKAHALYVEHRLITLAKEFARAQVENGNDGSIPRLSAADRADAERFLREFRFILPLFGVHVFQPPGQTRGNRLAMKGKTFEAEGQLLADGHFTVLKGAVLAPRLRDSAPEAVVKNRKRLVENGSLQKQNGKLILTRNYEFTSPSAAAAVVAGGATNGLTAWKDGRGRSLKDLEESA